MKQNKIIVIDSWLKNILIQFFIVAGFFCIAFVINKIPHNFSVAGGDFYQIIEPKANLFRYFYSWLNQIGQGMFNTLSMTFPFYTMLAVLNYIGLDSGIIAGFYMFFVLYFSYLSFYFSANILFPNLRSEIRIGGSLLYALNNWTFTLFVFPWAFSHHILFYIFIPPLLSLFIKIFSEENFLPKEMALFSLFFMLSTISYNNIAFFAVLLLAQFIIFIFLAILGKLKLGLVLMKNMISMAVVYFIGALYFILPFYLANSEYQNKILKAVALGGNALRHIEQTSNSLLNVFQLDINGFGSQPGLINILYPLILFFLIFKFSRIREKKSAVVIALAGLLMLLIMLAVRLREPFIGPNTALFKNIYFNLFRSPDKIFMLLPFSFVMLMVGTLHHLKFKKIFNYLVVLILLVVPYNFYMGGVAKILKNINTVSNEEYYSYVVKIPNEYYEVRDAINREKGSQNIISLPYSVKNSLNWSNYPAWHFNGHDILYLLYNKNYISANSYDHPSMETQLSFKKFNEKNGSAEELLNLIKNFSGQFVFFHKDITKYWIEQSLPTKNALEQLKIDHQLNLISSNDYFDLYQVKDDNLLPLVYSYAANFFEKVNPSKYRIILNLRQTSDIVFNQSHSSQWKLYLNSNPSKPWCEPSERKKEKLKGKTGAPESYGGTECPTGRQFFQGEELSYLWKQPVFEDTHKIVNQYANQWTIDPEYIKNNFSKEYYKENPDGSIDVELTLYFRPQSYFYLGLLVSGATLLGCLGYLGWDWSKRRKEGRALQIK